MPKDGIDGMDAGAEKNSSSLFSSSCPKLVQLLCISCPDMTPSMYFHFEQSLSTAAEKDEDMIIVPEIYHSIERWHQYVELCFGHEARLDVICHTHRTGIKI